MKNLKIFVLINLIIAALSTALTLFCSFDLSLIAFPISLVYTFFLFYFSKKVFIDENLKFIGTLRRFFQYEPFVFISAFVLQRAGKKSFPFVYDLFFVLLWLAILIISSIILFYISEKRMTKLSKKWKDYRENNPIVKANGLKKVLMELGEWADALIQAVFTIMILNIFIFQIYQIPSESMVPTFLIKDKVIVGKLFAGPKFPMSKVGIPTIHDYKTGDIVVFRNPHYINDQKSEFKTFFSQFIYMCTLTLVKDLNTDENGNIKADPLVKRILGVPGEQLIMMDGELYARTSKNNEFKAVKINQEKAAWDLKSLPSKIKSKVEYFPEFDYNDVLVFEEQRRKLDLVSAALECESISRNFKQYFKAGKVSPDKINKLLKPNDMYVFNLFGNMSEKSQYLRTTNGGAQWFDAFMNDWHRNMSNLNKYKNDGSLLGENLVGGDLYTDSKFRINVMAKLLFGRLILENAKIQSNPTLEIDWVNSEKRIELSKSLSRLMLYIFYMDQRNMGLFPANDLNGNAVYLPENTYFMMGDNRYNSLDMRHSYNQSLKTLTDFDSYSVYYLSNLAPQGVTKDRILGKASFILSPFSRSGSPDSPRRK